jgi:hypothetical protein
MLRALAVGLAFCFVNLPTLHAAAAPVNLIAQDQPPAPDQSQDQQQDQGPAYENYSPDQLDNLLSPIALYPDPLLAQLFVAATFPDQVEEAARYVRVYDQNGVDEQNWDVSVRAIAHYPTVVEMMADKIDWTTSVGQAYVNQSTDVAASVQHLRHLARDAGNLASSPQEEVIEHDNYIAISPYQPEYIYVPIYDPAICYFRRPYWGPAITFGAGFPIGAWLNLDFRWGYGGGWGGVYYTGWRREGWGGGCWNCGWIGRSRGRININNNVYINNRYTNVTVNRTVINRTVNVNNINRYNSVHKNVNYNNVQANNDRANRVNNRNNARPVNYGGTGGRGNSPGGNDRPGVSNKIIDRNIDRNNPQINQYRGQDNNARTDRPPGGQQRSMPAQPQRNDNRSYPQQPQNRAQYQQQQGRQAPQSQMTRPEPHTFSPNEGNFNPYVSSQRGQASRQAPAQQRPAPQPREQARSAPAQRGGGARKP